MYKAYANRTFPIYYDTNDEKITKNVLNQEFKIFRLGRMPALLIVDKEQIIQYAYYGDNMKDIPENDEILSFLKDLNKNITELG